MIPRLSPDIVTCCAIQYYTIVWIPEFGKTFKTLWNLYHTRNNNAIPQYFCKVCHKVFCHNRTTPGKSNVLFFEEFNHLIKECILLVILRPAKTEKHIKINNTRKMFNDGLLSCTHGSYTWVNFLIGFAT